MRNLKDPWNWIWQGKTLLTPIYQNTNTAQCTCTLYRVIQKDEEFMVSPNQNCCIKQILFETFFFSPRMNKVNLHFFVVKILKFMKGPKKYQEQKLWSLHE